MDEMQQALFAAGGVTVTCFSAPCLMGAMESAYELRECTELYIGSQETSGYLWWIGTMENITHLLYSNPAVDLSTLGKNIIHYMKLNIWHKLNTKMFRHSVLRSLPFFTMSVVDTAGMEPLADALDEFAQAIIQRYQHNRFSRVIERIRQRCDSVPYASKTFDSSIDVYDFSKKCRQGFWYDLILRIKAKQVMNALEDVIIARANGPLHWRAHGLSLYFPHPSFYNTTYASCGLDFTQNTHWDEFLQLHSTESYN